MFVGKRQKPEWLETETVLSYFGKEKKEAIANYKSYGEKVTVEAVEDPNKNLLGGFILGGTDFVNRVKDKFLSIKPPQLTLDRYPFKICPPSVAIGQ